MSPEYRGRVISVETGVVTDMRRQNHVWAALAVVIVWSFFAGFGMIAGASAGTQLVLIAVFGAIALYIYTVGRRSGPTVVYEHGIEYSTGLSRRFYPWHRLMYGWEDERGLTLRRVHDIEASLGLLDDREESVHLVVVPFDMPDYDGVVDYILRAMKEAHEAHGSRWRWRGASRYR